MRAAERLWTLARDVVSSGAVGLDAVKELESGRLRILDSGDVNWADPLRPVASQDSLVGASTPTFWSNVGDAHPTWVNLSWYRLSDGGGCVVVEYNKADERGVWADPGVSVSGSPEAARLIVED